MKKYFKKLKQFKKLNKPEHAAHIKVKQFAIPDCFCKHAALHFVFFLKHLEQDLHFQTLKFTAS